MQKPLRRTNYSSRGRGLTMTALAQAAVAGPIVLVRGRDLFWKFLAPDLKAPRGTTQTLHSVVSDAHKGLSMAIEEGRPACAMSPRCPSGGQGTPGRRASLPHSSLQQLRRRSQLAGHLHEDDQDFRSLQLVACFHDLVPFLVRGLALRIAEHLEGHDDLVTRVVDGAPRLRFFSASSRDYFMKTGELKDSTSCSRSTDIGQKSPEVRLNRLNCVFLNSKPEKTSNSLLTFLAWPVPQSWATTAKSKHIETQLIGRHAPL